MHSDEFDNTKVQMIVIIQNINAVLNIAEIEIYSKYDPTLNIAPTHIKCFNLPIRTDWVWYEADESNGFATVLNDENILTFTETKSINCLNETCLNICYLNEPLEINHIIIYPRQSDWRFYRT